MNTTIRHFYRLTCTLFVVLGLLGLMAPESYAAKPGSTVQPVSNLVAKAVSQSQVGLTWAYTDASKISGYSIERSLSPTSSFQTIATATPLATSLTDSPLADGKSYYYRMRAFTKTGKTTSYSSYSPIATATTPTAVVADTTAPTVAITSPANGTTLTSAQTLLISVTAADNIGVSKVELYDGATLKGTDTTAPYSFSWALTSANNGSHNLTAQAYDAAGNVASSTAVAITVNIAVAASVYTAPVLNPVTISNGNYLLTWSLPTTTYGVPEGGYDVFVDGVDDSLHHTTLSAVKSGLKLDIEHCFVVEARWTQAVPSVFPASNKVCVQGTQSADVTAPTVSIGSPATGTTFTSAQTVTIAASASDNVGISKVELYNGTTLMATDTTAPYSFAWAITDANNGSHSLTAKAYDAAGNSKVTAALSLNINIAVAPAVYVAPVLNSVTIINDNYVLSWSLPSNAYGTPAGGYDTFVDGVDDSQHYTTLSAIKSGLPQDIEHCFKVEARWTQAIPGVYPASNQICVPATAPADEVTSPSTRTPLSLRIDPTFTVDSLPAETRLWYNRFLAGMRNPSQYPNSTTSAQSGDLYGYGRTLNTNITTVLQMLRVTGDRQLLDEVDRLAQLMRAKLKDSSILTHGGSTYQADGYLNWQWLNPGDANYYGTDVHMMDEMLTHSLVASYAYAFHLNRDLDPRYAERAQFWTNYLKNHFEAKWRKRNNKATGFPFLEKNLAHPYMQFVRYHFYMAKLTGDTAYENEALRMAGNIQNQIKEVSTPIGTGAVWAHGMTTLGSTSTGIQSTSYARYTVQGAADLAAEGFSVFGQAGYMERIAVTLANNVMDGNLSAYAAYINGSGSGGESLDTYAISPWAMIGRWDKTGEVQVETDRVYRKLEASPENPKRIHLPAGMVYLLTR